MTASTFTVNLDSPFEQICAELEAAKKAFDKAINNANKVAMSLSDLFCVDRHKPHFLNLVKNKLDITFANEQEITSLIEAKNFEEVINFSKQLKKYF